MEINFDLDLTGFSTVEIESYLDIEGPACGEEETLDASSLTQRPVSRVGDIWVLSSGNLRHRLLCGSCHDRALLEELFEGKRAAASFADFPYNVPIKGFVSGTGRHTEFKEASGEMSDPEFVSFLVSSFAAIFPQLENDAVLFGCMDWRHVWHLVEAARREKLELLNIAVWVKTNGGMGSLYRSQHELICVFKRPDAEYRNNVELGRHGRSRTNVWEYRGVNVTGPERYLLDLHPTPKPTAMVADAIRDVTKPGDIVFDPFVGSGTTLIAAERTKRVCYAIDIEPKYVDLSIRRWQAETGRDAVRLSDGLAFNIAEDLEKAAAVASKEDFQVNSSDDDDTIGYGKPPKATRFAPGRSGNPKGRPRTGRSVGVEIRAELKRLVTIRENGKEQRVTKAAALAKQIVARALAGDTRAFQQLAKLLPADFIPPPDAAANTGQPIDVHDAEILERFFAQRLQQASAPSSITASNNQSDHKE